MDAINNKVEALQKQQSLFKSATVKPAPTTIGSEEPQKVIAVNPADELKKKIIEERNDFLLKDGVGDPESKRDANKRNELHYDELSFLNIVESGGDEFKEIVGEPYKLLKEGDFHGLLHYHNARTRAFKTNYKNITGQDLGREFITKDNQRLEQLALNLTKGTAVQYN